MKRIFVFLMSLMFTTTTTANITSINIALATIQAAPSCGQYQIRGTCLWLKFSSIGIPYIDTTYYVRHYLPDTVVTVFSEAGENPWVEANTLIDTPAKAAINPIYRGATGFSLGSGSIRSQTHSLGNIQFREVDVIGNPFIHIISPFIFFGMETHPSQAAAFYPYYLTIADSLSWRNEWLEMLNPNSWIPGFSELGNFPLYSWGPVFPRTGFLNQPDEGKASAVFALRAMNIATSNAWQHVSTNLDANHCGRDCQTTGAVADNDKTLFQMIEPVMQTDCKPQVSPHLNDT